MGGDVFGIPKPLIQPVVGRGWRVSTDDVRHWTGGRNDRGPLIPSFGALASDTFDPAAVHPSIWAFYEQTDRFTVSMERVYWERWARPIMLAYVATARWGLGNLLMPPTTENARRMSSAVMPVHWSDGLASRLWVRTFTGTGQVFYVASLRECVVDGATYISVAFPIRLGHVLVLLRLRNFRGNGMLASSSDEGYAGTYMVTFVSGRPVVLPGPPTTERLGFEPEPGGRIRAFHEGRAVARRTFEVRYECRPNTP